VKKCSYAETVALILVVLTFGCAQARTETDSEASSSPQPMSSTGSIPKKTAPFALSAIPADEIDDLINALGGKPKDPQKSGKPVDETPEPVGEEGAIKKMVTRLKGKYEATKDESNHTVISISLQSTAVTDKDLAILKNATNLISLDLSGTLITDDGIAHLKSLTGLQQLHLDGTNTTGASFIHLRGMTQLRVLNISFGFGTGGAEDNLVRAFGPKVDADSLKHIERLTSLVDLNLEGCSIGDEGLSHVAKLTKLVVLNLASTDITDNGLKQLKGLAALKELDLSTNEEITNAGLAHLKGLTKLEILNTEDTKITEAARARYKKPSSPDSKLQGISSKPDEPGALNSPGRTPLPKYFDKLELSEEQEQKVIKTMKQYDEKIATVRQKVADASKLPVGGTSIVIAGAKTIKRLTSERQQALEDILTEKQRDKLQKLTSDK
jgi:Leucine-rich repeat (LRR) protein